VNYKRNLILVLLFVSFMVASIDLTIPTASAGIPAEMVSYWKLDETTGTTATDYVGTHDGTLKPPLSEPTWTTSGQVNGALSFDGIDDYVDCGDITELNSASGFTVLGWYKDDNIVGHNRHFDKGDGLDHDISGATYSSRLYIEVGNGANSYAYWSGYSSVISSGEWYHTAFVFNGSGATNADKAKIYVNGVERSLSFGGGSMPSSTADLTGYPFTISKAVNPWDGDIDEVAIFNRALSAIEILDLYDKGLAGHGYCWPPPVGGHWLPINKSVLLLPWITIASLMTVATVSIIYLKRRKKQQS